MKLGDILLLAVIGVIVLNIPGLGGTAVGFPAQGKPGMPGYVPAIPGTGQPITLWQKFFNSSGYTGGL
jgi:hypothetical protein